MTIPLNQALDDSSASTANNQFMSHLQANILKGHGREHVVLLCLAIDDVSLARTFLHRYPVTDALTQFKETEAFNLRGSPGGIIRLVFISHSGLARFGKAQPFAALDQTFVAGMAADVDVLDEGNQDSWQAALKDTPTDVMLLLAFHDPKVLARMVAKLVGDLELGAFKVLLVQEGRAYKNALGEGVEHFGYVDGRSQPLMLKSAVENESRFVGGTEVFKPQAPLSQFIVADPLSPADFGSYFVFRKLEQNVAGFKAREEDFAKALALGDGDKERAGAMVIGRFEDGLPVTLLDHVPRVGIVPVANDFTYDNGAPAANFPTGNDEDGKRCPFAGHIRKTHPRKPEFNSHQKQMARRGITYGTRLQHPDTKEFIDKPNDGVGLLFMSYQASITDQFQFMQKSWANNPNFPPAANGPVGLDPVIGQLSSKGQTPPGQFPLANGERFAFHGFVTLKGGEYFYTPSLPGLKAL